MKLRLGTAGDVAEMYRLDCLCFEEPFRFDLHAMREFAQELVVIAEEDGAMRGFVIYDLEGDWAYVTTLDVDPAYRRQGIASMLMEEADRIAIAAAVTEIRLHVFAGNEAAIRFYEGCGYRRVSVSPGFYGHGLDGIFYLKRIAQAGTKT